MFVTSVVIRVTRPAVEIFVNVGKAESLDVFKHRTTQVAGKAGGCMGTADRTQDAEQQAEQRSHDQ